MKILSTERRTKILNGQVTNAENPAYLYELLHDGNVTQRHGMINSTLTNELKKKELNLDNAQVLDGLSFHNLTVSVFGPYITTFTGEQVYTFRNDHTMVKLDPGMTSPEVNHYLSFPKGVYSCVSYDMGGAVKSIEYLAILNSGAIRFQYKYAPTAYRMTILTNKELPENVTKHLLCNNVGQGTVETKSSNNPAIGFKLLLDLLDEVESNGDTPNS